MPNSVSEKPKNFAIMEAKKAAKTQKTGRKGFSWKTRFSLFVSCSFPLMACGGLDHQKIAQDIQQEVVRNGGVALQAVTCPQGIQPRAGETFECIGKMDNGYTFAISVQQQDEQGNVSWEIPHAKGLVNLTKLEALMQKTLASEIKSSPAVSCNGIYKAVTPGESFECQLSYSVPQPTSKTPKPSSQPTPASVTRVEKINVTIDLDGNVRWQRIPLKIPAKPTKS